MPRMSRRGQTSWRAVHVCGHDGASQLRQLSGTARLVALYRLQTGEAGRELCFTRPGEDGPVLGAPDVEWDGFPMIAALEAVTFDELRRLRGLLGAEVTSQASPGPEATILGGFLDARAWVTDDGDQPT